MPKESVVLTLVFHRDENHWVGVCRELSTSTFAETLDQCEQELTDLVVDHLNALEELGQREAFFERWGIELREENEMPAQVVLDTDGEAPVSEWLRDFLQPHSGPVGSGLYLQPRVFPAHGGPQKARSVAVRA